MPARFSVTIPADIASRTYTLTALAGTKAGQKASVTIEIDVERPDMPTSIAPLLTQIIFDAPGDEFPIVALADFPAEDAVDVTASSKVTYSSSDQAVAVVSANGMVTATRADPRHHRDIQIPATVSALKFRSPFHPRSSR